jgi:hypothetical protein
MEKRKTDYEKLNYEYSIALGDDMHEELMQFVFLVEDRLRIRMESIESIFKDEGLL